MATDWNFNKFTYEDYALIPNDGNRHEIIEGDHYMNPAPNAYHQTVSGRLQYQLYSQIVLKKLGYVFDAPFDVQLDEFNIVQSDLVVILNDRKSILSKQKVNGVPNLIMEILTPSNSGRDCKTKKNFTSESRFQNIGSSIRTRPRLDNIF